MTPLAYAPYAADISLGGSGAMVEWRCVYSTLPGLGDQGRQLPRAACEASALAGGGCGGGLETGAVPGLLFGVPAVADAATFLCGHQGAVVEVGGVAGDSFGAIGWDIVDDPVGAAGVAGGQPAAGGDSSLVFVI